MKSIVISQADFEAIESSQFTFAVREDNREFENNSYPAGYDDEGNVEYRDCYNSFVAGEATAKYGELEINSGGSLTVVKIATRMLSISLSRSTTTATPTMKQISALLTKMVTKLKAGVSVTP